jgi:hypothetical protein
MIFYKFFSILVKPSEAFTRFPVEDLVFLVLEAVDPPFANQISYSTLEAKKSAECNMLTIEVFILALG